MYDAPMDSGEALVPRRDAPAWVKLGLWQLETRSSAKAFLVLSAALGAVGVAAGALVSPAYFVAMGFWLAVPWYYRAIRWMDAHRAWPAD